MTNTECIKEILELLNRENEEFDGNIYSFSYFPKNHTEDGKIKFRPAYTITGHETIKKYNELYTNLYKNIVGNRKMTFKVFRDNTQNFIFENRFTENELIKFVKDKKEYTTNEIYKIFGIEMSNDYIKYGKYTFVKKDYINTYLKSITTLKQTKLNELELKLLANDSNKSDWNFAYIISQHKTIDNLYSTQLMNEEIKTIVNVLRFMACIKWDRVYIDFIPFISYQKSHFQFVDDWMTSGHNFIRKDRAIPIDNEWFGNEDIGHKYLWDLLDFDMQKNEMEERVIKSIEWVGKAYGEDDEKVALLEIAFAFEALLIYNPKGIINQSIIASLSESYAFINGSNVDERIELEKEFKHFYEERSGLVHGLKNKLDEKKINPYKMITMTIRNIITSPIFSKCNNIESLSKEIKRLKYTTI